MLLNIPTALARRLHPVASHRIKFYRPLTAKHLLLSSQNLTLIVMRISQDTTHPYVPTYAPSLLVSLRRPHRHTSASNYLPTLTLSLFLTR
jgi:hypothetical protein